MATNRRWGFHDGVLTAYRIIVNDTLTIKGAMTFGDASADTLTVNGAATFNSTAAFDGAVTLGDAIGDNITIAGNVIFGTTGTPIVHTSEAEKLFSMYVTNNATSGGTSYEPFFLSTTLTGAGQVGGRGKFLTTINAAAGGWSNALKAEVVYGASGKTTGLGSAMIAEMTLSAGTVDGNYAAFEAELNIPSGASLGTKTAFHYMSAQGADIATFDTSGLLLNIQGLTAGAGKLFDSSANLTNAQIDHSLKIQIGAITGFIPIMDNADGS